MANQEQNQTPSGGQGQPSAGTQGQPTSNPEGSQPASPGLMGMAHVKPSGTEYKSYDPVDSKGAEVRDRR